MIPLRLAAFTGFCYTAPMTLWILPLLGEADSWEQAEAVLQQAGHAMLLLQGLAVMLLSPLFPVRGSPRQATLAVVLTIAVPWPLLALTWLVQSFALAPLLLSQLALVTAGVLFLNIARLPLLRPFRSTLVPVLQILALVLLLKLHFLGFTDWLRG